LGEEKDFSLGNAVSKNSAVWAKEWKGYNTVVRQWFIHD
jgi:hypothetical protein